jgi:choline dehydrogenase-like flavoprotein
MSLPIGKRGAIVEGRQIDKDLTLRPDVCVVGSGPGGSMIASRLSAAGAQVVVLEEGGHFTRDDFDMQEAKAFPTLYQDRGNRASADLGIAVLQGRAVGGGTVVNWTTSFRTPERVLEHWQQRHGSSFSAAALRPHFEEVEKRLNVTKQTLEETNPNNRALYDGCKKMGWEVDTTSRNIRGCMRTGYCGTGCPIDAKQSAALTYLPDAVAAGAVVYASCRAERVETSAGRATAVIGRVAESGRAVRVEPKVVVVSGGALNSPALLLRSGLRQGPVGRFTWLHPVTAVAAQYRDVIEPFYGAPQSVASHHFVTRPDKPGAMGFFLEASPGQPMLSSLAMPGFGAWLRERMLLLDHLALSISLSIDGFGDDEQGGTVRLKPDGGPRLDYPFPQRLLECFRAGMKALVQAHLANGAERAVTLHIEPLEFAAQERDLGRIDRAPLGPNLCGVFTAHQMGGCRMGKDPAHSVVSPELRHHAVQNLFVIDGSVFPTSLGVNPMESIYGISSWASQHVIAAAKG